MPELAMHAKWATLNVLAAAAVGGRRKHHLRLLAPFTSSCWIIGMFVWNYEVKLSHHEALLGSVEVNSACITKAELMHGHRAESCTVHLQQGFHNRARLSCYHFMVGLQSKAAQAILKT